MQLLKAKIFVLIVFFIDNIQTELSPDGKNVCLKTEIYEEKIQFKVQKPVVSQKKRWCWSLRKLFRCTRTNTHWQETTELRPIKRTRIVPNCCDGYVEVRNPVSSCSPACLKQCVNGICVAPEKCACFSGFYGSQCEKECSEGFWGENCVNTCHCFNNGKCDKKFGTCDCEQGWIGDRCEFSCQNGYYGYKCSKTCDCGGYSCNHTTGECFTTTTTTTAELPTTSITTKLLAKETSFEANLSKDIIKLFVDNKKIKEVDATGDSDSTEMSINEERTTIIAIIDLNTSTDVVTTENIDFSETSKIFENKKTEKDVNEDTRLKEMSATKEIATDIVVSNAATSTIATAIKNIDISETTESTKNIKKTIASKMNSSTTLTVDVLTTEMEAEKSKETDIKLMLNIQENETDILNELETSTNNVNNNINKETEITNNKNVFMKAFTKSSAIDTTQVNFIRSEQSTDKDETNNFNFSLNEIKGSSNRKTWLKIFHFLPGLSVFSSVSFVAFVTAVIWLICKHRNKTRKTLEIAETNQKEGQIKYPVQNFWSNTCTNNSVYLSDADLNRKTLILETFKPLNCNKN